MLSVFKNIKFN